MLDDVTRSFWERQLATATGPFEATSGRMSVWAYRVTNARTGATEIVDERAIPYEVRPWRPFIKTQAVRPDGTPDPEVESGKEEFWANSHYLVYLRRMKSEDPEMPDAVHLSLRTVENDTRHDWRDFQRIKNELVGPHWEAVELYPDVDRLVDSANQYHLFCFPFRLPFGFHSKLVLDHGHVEQIGGKQRPL